MYEFTSRWIPLGWLQGGSLTQNNHSEQIMQLSTTDWWMHICYGSTRVVSKNHSTSEDMELNHYFLKSDYTNTKWVNGLAYLIINMLLIVKVITTGWSSTSCTVCTKSEPIFCFLWWIIVTIIKIIFCQNLWGGKKIILPIQNSNI